MKNVEYNINCVLYYSYSRKTRKSWVYCLITDDRKNTQLVFYYHIAYLQRAKK